MRQTETTGHQEIAANARPYRAGDEEKIVQLLDTVFNGWPSFDLVHSAIDYWRWRYRDYPGKPGVIVVYQADDEIVGCTHSSPRHMKIGDKLCSGCLGGDIAILKTFRRRGIASAMIRLATRLRKEAGMRFTYYETRNPGLLHSFKKMVQRDRRYLNWRYCDLRGGNYRVKYAEDADGIQGYIVLRIDTTDKDYPIAYIVDFLCKAGHPDAAQALIADSLNHFDQQGVSSVHCLVPKKHPYRKLFAGHGFVDTLERTIIFLQANMPMEEQMAALKFIGPGQAYYSYGDIDTI